MGAFTTLTIQSRLKAYSKAAENNFADTLVGQETAFGAQHERSQNLHNFEQHDSIRVVVATNESRVSHCVSNVLDDNGLVRVGGILNREDYNILALSTELRTHLSIRRTKICLQPTKLCW